MTAVNYNTATTMDMVNTDTTHATAGVTPLAPDATDGGTFTNSGTQVLIVQNPDSDSAVITVSRTDGGTNHATTIATGKSAMLGPFDPKKYGETATVKNAASDNLAIIAVVDLASCSNLITR